MLSSALSCFIAVWQRRFSRKHWIFFLFGEWIKVYIVFLSASPQVALHACGVATDMVMEHCIQAGAAFVISPCCYGFIQNAIKFTFPKRCAPAHRCPMSPLRGSAVLNVSYSGLGLLLDLWYHRCFSSLTFSYWISELWIFCLFVSVAALVFTLIVTDMHTHNLSLVSAFFWFTLCLLSSALTVWGSNTSPSQQGPPLPHSILTSFSQRQRAGSSKWRLS